MPLAHGPRDKMGGKRTLRDANRRQPSAQQRIAHQLPLPTQPLPDVERRLLGNPLPQVHPQRAVEGKSGPVVVGRPTLSDPRRADILAEELAELLAAALVADVQRSLSA